MLICRVPRIESHVASVVTPLECFCFSEVIRLLSRRLSDRTGEHDRRPSWRKNRTDWEKVWERKMQIQKTSPVFFSSASTSPVEQG